MDYAVPYAGVTTIPVADAASAFPVRRVYLVGRNYAAHAREMGHDPNREPPFFFQKPADAILLPGNDFPYPAKSSDVHHEMELVVALGNGGSDIAEADALEHVFGYAVGIDMTRRDLQAEAKKMGRPWEVGKAFESSAPISAIVPATQIGHPSAGRVWLEVNGELRQEGNLDQLIWNIPETIACLSSLFTLAAGDLIFTGTPAGVGPVQIGDTLSGGVEGVGELRVQVV